MNRPGLISEHTLFKSDLEKLRVRNLVRINVRIRIRIRIRIRVRIRFPLKNPRDKHFSGFGHWFGFDLGFVFAQRIRAGPCLDSGSNFGPVWVLIRVRICVRTRNRIQIFITKPFKKNGICILLDSLLFNSDLKSILSQSDLKNTFVFFLVFAYFSNRIWKIEGSGS